MHADERAIRDVIDTWQKASADGDLPRALELMTDDVVFLVHGHPPMRGRQAFADAFKQASRGHRIDARSDVEEVVVSGDFAYCVTHLTVTMSPPAPGMAVRRSGHVLTVFRREPDGRWRLARDANLIAPDGGAS